MDRLGSFVDPKTGKKPVKAIYKREDVFKGKHADTAPDILMEPTEGYSLTHAKTRDRGRRLGERRPPHGGRDRGGRAEREAVRATTPALIDMAPTIVAALDAPDRGEAHRTGAARDRRGRGRAGGARGRGRRRGPRRRAAIPGMTIPGMGGESAVSDTEADEMEEHLRGLGYIE